MSAAVRYAASHPGRSVEWLNSQPLLPCSTRSASRCLWQRTKFPWVLLLLPGRFTWQKPVFSICFGGLELVILSQDHSACQLIVPSHAFCFWEKRRSQHRVIGVCVCLSCAWEGTYSSSRHPSLFKCITLAHTWGLSLSALARFLPTSGRTSPVMWDMGMLWGDIGFCWYLRQPSLMPWSLKNC